MSFLRQLLFWVKINENTGFDVRKGCAFYLVESFIESFIAYLHFRDEFYSCKKNGSKGPFFVDCFMSIMDR